MSSARATVLLLALAACTPAAPSRVPEVHIATPAPAPAADPEAPRARPVPTGLAGEWSETWGVEGETDVTYHDVYVLSGSGGALKITCPERPLYAFTRVSFRGTRLVVHLVNGGTEIDYDLELDATSARLVGRAKTSAGIDAPIVWDRLGKSPGR